MDLGKAWLKKRPESWMTLLGLFGVLLVDLVDYLISADLRFTILYLAPVMLAAWFGGSRSGIIVALAAAISRTCIEVFLYRAATHAWVPYLNLILLALLFSVVAALASSVRQMLSRSEELVALRTSELEKQVAERQRAEVELRISDERFRQLTGNIKEVFWMTNVEKSEMLYISPGYEAIWGRSCQSLYQNPRSWLEAIDPEDRERVLAAAMKQQVELYDEQYRIIRPDGSRRWIRDRGFPVFDANGAVYRIAGVADDITEQKEAEEALSKSELQLRLVWENSVDGMRLMDEAGNFIAVNDAYCRLVERSREQLLGQPLAVIFPEDRHEHVLGRHQERFRARSIPSHSEEELKLWNGKTVHLEITSSFLESPGSPARLLSIFRDVSERKKAEVVLAEKEERFRLFMDNSALIAFIKDKAGRFQYVNSTLQKRFSFPLLGKTAFDCYPPEVARRLQEKDELVIASRKTFEFTDSIPFPNGTVTEWVNYKFPFTDSAGNVFVGGVSVEITQQRKLENQLLEISDREQARIGHDLHDELCQFLVGILFHCQDLSGALRAARRPEAAPAEQIAELINSAITQARQLARGLFPVLLEREGLIPALEEFALGVKGRFKMECSVQCDNPINIHQRVVANNLYRIAQEAVHNAAHHGRARQITIRLGASDSTLDMAITDDGVGMTNGVRSKGMGLHIMNYRAHTIGGTLEIKSPPGSGTSIVCRVPLEKL
jgi:PAS domain S-box-containing protein